MSEKLYSDSNPTNDDLIIKQVQTDSTHTYELDAKYWDGNECSEYTSAEVDTLWDSIS